MDEVGVHSDLRETGLVVVEATGQLAPHEESVRVRHADADIGVQAYAITARDIAFQLMKARLLTFNKNRLPSVLPQARRVREVEAVPGSELDTNPRAQTDSIEDLFDDPVFPELR